MLWREFRQSVRGQGQAAISWVLDGSAFLAGDQFVPREAVEDFVDNRCLSPLERMAALMDNPGSD